MLLGLAISLPSHIREADSLRLCQSSKVLAPQSAFYVCTKGGQGFRKQKTFVLAHVIANPQINSAFFFNGPLGMSVVASNYSTLGASKM